MNFGPPLGRRLQTEPVASHRIGCAQVFVLVSSGVVGGSGTEQLAAPDQCVKLETVSPDRHREAARRQIFMQPVQVQCVTLCI